jgi:hypothetical protein
MALLKKGFDFYINSSIHVALAIWCLVKITDYKASQYALLAFFGTIVGYNFLKYFKWFLTNKSLRISIIGIIIITLIAALGFLLLFFEQDFKTQCYLIVAIGLVLLYVYIRKFGWLKLFFVSFVVSYVTAFIPFKDSHLVIWFFLHRFFLLSSIIIPFEILDSPTDSISMKTLPHLFGIPRTKQIGYVLVSLYCIASIYALPIYNHLFIYAFSSVVVIYFSTEKRSWYYTSFWVESLPIIWWLTLYFQP